MKGAGNERIKILRRKKLTTGRSCKAVLITAVIIAVILIFAISGCVQEKYSYLEIYGRYTGEFSEEREDGGKETTQYELKLYLDGSYEAKEERGNGEETKEYGSFIVNPIALECYRITLKSEVRVDGNGTAEENKSSILRKAGFKHEQDGEGYALSNEDGIRLIKTEDEAEETMEANVLLGAFGGTIEENRIGITVEESVARVKVGDYLYFSPQSEWELYYDGAKTEKSESKTAALKRGLTELYVTVGSPDEWYEVDFYREYESPVEFRSEGVKVGETKVKANSEISAESVPSVAREGYGLVGWTDEEGRIWNFAEEEPTVGEGYRTYVFTAVWEAEIYTVKLKDGDLETASVEVEYNKEYKLPDMEKEGHRFLGWSDGAELVTDDTGESLGVWNYGENKEFVAVWRKNEYSVTVESLTENGGEYTGEGQYEYGDTAEITVKPINGYTFTGWYKGNEEVSAEKTVSVGIGAADTVLTAKYTEYFVEIYVNGSDGNLDYKRIRAEAGAPFTAETPEVPESKWDGWYDENGDKASDELAYTFDMPHGDVTVEARWTAEVSSKAAEVMAKILSGETVELDSDVDMSGTEWNVTEPYYGVINGNGYALKNVTVTCAYIENQTAYIGLFPVFSGTVSNLRIENVTVTAETDKAVYAGLFAGKVSVSGQLENVKIDGSLVISAASEYVFVGGFAGGSEGKITDCSSNAEVTVETGIGTPGAIYAAGFVSEAAAYTMITGSTASGKFSCLKDEAATLNAAGFAVLIDGNACLDGNSSEFIFN